MREPMYDCPSFNGCAAPVCPLESKYGTKDRFRLKGERECVATQRVRYNLGAGLRFHGLFAGEFNGYTNTGGFGHFTDRLPLEKGKVDEQGGNLETEAKEAT